MLEALTRSRMEGLPVVGRASGPGSDRQQDQPDEQLVGWVHQRIVVERIYEVQARARAAAATYTSLGSRLQDRWHTRPVPRRQDQQSRPDQHAPPPTPVRQTPHEAAEGSTTPLPLLAGL